MDDATARHLVENHPRMPRRYLSAHTLWSWIWLITVVLSCGVVPLLFGIRAAINKSAREFVTEFALEDGAFFDKGVAKKWFEVRARS